MTRCPLRPLNCFCQRKRIGLPGGRGLDLSLQETEKDAQHPEFRGLILLFLPQNRQPLAGTAACRLLPRLHGAGWSWLCAAALAPGSQYRRLLLLAPGLGAREFLGRGEVESEDWVCHILSYTVSEVSLLAPHHFICKKKNQK